MACAADMNHALRNNLIELQRSALVLLLCFSCLLAGGDSQELPQEEMDALQALKRAWNISTTDSYKYFENWNSSLPCGNYTFGGWQGGWNGVICDVNSTGATVTQLSLEYMRIVGDLPSEVSKLSNLNSIDLGFAKGLSGPIPKEIMQLRNLIYLNIRGNMFTGKFPFDSIMEGSKLQGLDIGSNQFNGSIENDAFRNLGRLQVLRLSGNNFTGKVPDISPMQHNLKYLDLSRNKFTVQAPDVSELNYLLSLDLSSNEFTGQSPNVSQMTQLYDLNMSWNRFEGLPPDLSSLRKLVYLDLSQNRFRGQIPDVYNLSVLQYLDLSQNEFTGKPPDLYDLPRLTMLNLSSNNFTGLSDGLSLFPIPVPSNLTLLDLSSLHLGGPAPNLTNLPESLSALYLDKNNFTGTLNISAFLESNASKSLKVLSLKDNMITDAIVPNSQIINYAMGFTNITLQGNPYCNRIWTSQDEATACNVYCKSTSCVYKLPKTDRRIIIMASSISSGVILLVILGFGFVLRRKEKYIRDLQNKIKEADVNARRFDYNVLRDATKNFAPEMKLGEGGYGAVYKGILAGNIVVAVKQLLLNTNASREDFVNEILLISNLQHRNLVALKGYALKDRQTLILVYEYVDNGDLDKLLLNHQGNTGSTSDGLQLWKTRLKICQGVAQGLYYLHTSSQSRILHRDIKASNILLDKNFEAKIADFGLARLIAGSVTMTGCAGTIGYLAPEYANAGQLSDKADVYSFGVLLLEIVSGMRNRDQRMPEDELHLTTWVCHLFTLHGLQKKLLCWCHEQASSMS